MEYITIKSVNAEPMTGVDAEKKGYRTNGNTGDGFEVTYVDGYKSWCPKDVFLRDAYEVKNAALTNTCKRYTAFLGCCGQFTARFCFIRVSKMIAKKPLVTLVVFLGLLLATNVINFIAMKAKLNTAEQKYDSLELHTDSVYELYNINKNYSRVVSYE